MPFGKGPIGIRFDCLIECDLRRLKTMALEAGELKLTIEFAQGLKDVAWFEKQVRSSNLLCAIFREDPLVSDPINSCDNLCRTHSVLWK